MRPRAKYAVIHRHRSEYSVSTMCRFFGVSRSGYYDFVRRIGKPEKDAELAAAIRRQQEKSFNTYGYRRMCLALASKGIHCNPKTILRVMKKYDLLSEIRRRRKWVNMGQQLHRYENLLNRQFHANKPNRKWVTDISYPMRPICCTTGARCLSGRPHRTTCSIPLAYISQVVLQGAGDHSEREKVVPPLLPAHPFHTAAG